MIAKIIKIVQETPNIMTFRFDVKLDFKPGQYITIYHKFNNKLIARQYSISSMPGKDYIELTIRKVENGLFSSYIIDNGKINDTFEIKGPFGKFYFEEGISNIVLIAAGCGIAPLISMIRYIAERKLNVNVKLIYSCKTKNDIAFYDELNKIASKNIKIVYTLTREIKEGFCHGRINKEMFNDIDKNSLFYICGLPEMVDNTLETLKNLKIKEENIKFEKY